MNDLMLKETVLVEKMMTEPLDITMTKEEVPDTREQIPGMEVTRKVLSSLRLLMTGSEMRDLETAGPYLEIPSYRTKAETWTVLAPLLHVLLKRY